VVELWEEQEEEEERACVVDAVEPDSSMGWTLGEDEAAADGDACPY
jgi:hypothetical protein